MLFDPSATDRHVAADTGGERQSSRAASARRRPAADFLTLPGVAEDVPTAARLKWREDLSLTGLVRKQFQYGPLLASDVRAPVDAGDAFQQAFFAWTARQCGQLERLTFAPVLFDTYALREVLHHCGTTSNDDDPAPLYFGIELDNEWVHHLGEAVDALRTAHPLLLRTVMTVMNRASGRTLFLRTPDWFMYEFSCWYWDGDDSITDEEAAGLLKERFGEDDETRQQYLPSVVRAALCPDDLTGSEYVDGKWQPRPSLTRAEILRLRNRSRGMSRRVCTELLALEHQMSLSKSKDLFQVKYETNPVYAACSVVLQRDDRIGDLLDTHFDSESQSGEGTTYNGFAPIASGARAIRRQYADWALAFRILSHLDRLLALVTQPI